MSHICKACGTQGSAGLQSPSNFIVELIVWVAALFLAAATHWSILLGAIGFTIWRFANRFRVCAKCGSRDVIPANSPLGRQLAAQVRGEDVPTLKEPSP